MATGEMVMAGTPSKDLCGRKGTGSSAIEGSLRKERHRQQRCGAGISGDLSPLTFIENGTDPQRGLCHSR
jgi:hypothetical protein